MMVCPGVVRKAAKLVPTVLQALAFVVCIHVVGQGMLARYGPAKYRFSRNYQATGLGFGSNKVSKVSFAFCGARVGVYFISNP